MNTYFSSGIDEIFVVRGGRWTLELVLAKIKLNNSLSISIRFLTKAFCIDWLFLWRDEHKGTKTIL